jgi:hypothetical protein
VKEDMMGTEHHDNLSRNQTMTWTLAVALRRKLGGHYRINRVAWSGGQGQGLDVAAGPDQPMYRLSFWGWGGNHLMVGFESHGHPLDSEHVWPALAEGRIGVEQLAKDGATAARSYQRPVRHVDGAVDATATLGYEFLAAAMRASLTCNLGWRVDTAIQLDDGTIGYEDDDLASSLAGPYLSLLDESPTAFEAQRRTTADVADWHFVYVPDGPPVAAVNPVRGVYLPEAGLVPSESLHRAPSWRSVLRLLRPQPTESSDPLGTPRSGLTVALAAQTHTRMMVEHGFGSARLLASELHGPALSLSPSLRSRLARAAQITVPARAWVGRRVTCEQVVSAVARANRGPSKSMPGGGNDLVIDLVVAWADANSGEPVCIAVLVGSAAQLLEGSAVLMERMGAGGPADLRLVVLDLDDKSGPARLGLLRLSDLV